MTFHKNETKRCFA